MPRGSDRFSDNIIGAIRAIRRGDGYGPRAIRYAADEVRRERESRYPQPSRRGGWYTKADMRNGTVQLFVGPDGDITSERPHVHVIHDEPGGEIRLHITLANGTRVGHTTLPGNTDGNTVNNTIARLVDQMNELL